MIPDYKKFIRFQDKRLIVFLYLILFVILGFYWKNNSFSMSTHDALYLSLILAITLFNLLHELKAYWAYSYVMVRINLDIFTAGNSSRVERFLSRPVVVSLCSVPVFWGLVHGSLQLPEMYYSVIFLYFSVPLYIYFIYTVLRRFYINQVLSTMTSGATFKNLYQYVGVYIVVNTALNLLSVSPLQSNSDFSFKTGFLSPKLMVAMFILCAFVLAINLIFCKLTKRYIFLGRFFLKEITFLFSTSIPFDSLHSKTLMVRMFFLFIAEAAWILFVSFVIEWLNVDIVFSIYFLICYIPCLAYHFLHLYWYWHKEFLMSCDMFFRYDDYMKNKAMTD